MAFPGTYNFSYYKGDTLEFTVYPKDSSGAPFDLENFVEDGSPAFTIATARGEAGAEDQISCFAEISADFTNILCVIRPEDGEQLVAGQQYVYDIQISQDRGGDPYDIVYTILTGNINVTEQVTLAPNGES
jgi:hypothetical protein